ncbi:hypothetical protein K2P56_04425 [Patescibacteria group bacterium]|nr:hypothetical protein [Patescibacteria group bacterium]
MEKKLKDIFSHGEGTSTCFHCGKAVPWGSTESIEFGSHFSLWPFHENCVPLYIGHLLEHMELSEGSALSNFKENLERTYAACLFCGGLVLKERAKSIDGGYVHVTAKCLKYFHIR